MCLILFAHKVHPDYPLVLAANRDESYQRATAPAAFWQDDARVYGGRDLEQGGTWLGITRTGRVAALTNFRAGNAVKTSTRSRGELVGNYLRSNQPAAAYLGRTGREAMLYNGFNLLAGDVDSLHYFSNRAGAAVAVSPGIHGLSNHLLDTPWPKVERGKRALAGMLDLAGSDLSDALFSVLADRTPAPDAELPDSGIGLQRERLLSPAFIVKPLYGTRCSTVLLVDNQGRVTFSERSFGEGGKPGHAITGRFLLENEPLPLTA